MSKYTTAQGIRYEGQDLTGLTAHTAVEYMLACIPVLRQFHNIQAKTQRKLVVATAIVLRQFEEMEDDPIDSSQITSKELVDGGHHETQVNFLDIINTIVRASYDEGKVDHHDLLDVAYWICLRQEVYSAFTQKRTPQMLLAPEHWIDAATVDKTVMHAAQVAKWLFEDRSVDEWSTWPNFLVNVSIKTDVIRSSERATNNTRAEHLMSNTVRANTKTPFEQGEWGGFSYDLVWVRSGCYWCSTRFNCENGLDIRRTGPCCFTRPPGTSKSGGQSTRHRPRIVRRGYTPAVLPTSSCQCDHGHPAVWRFLHG